MFAKEGVVMYPIAPIAPEPEDVAEPPAELNPRPSKVDRRRTKNKKYRAGRKGRVPPSPPLPVEEKVEKVKKKDDEKVEENVSGATPVSEPFDLHFRTYISHRIDGKSCVSDECSTSGKEN